MNTARRHAPVNWRLRLAVMGFVIAACVLALLSALWRLQVARASEFERDQFRQSVRRVRVPGARGRILDRHGRVLADHRASFGLGMYLEEIRRPGPWARTIDAAKTLLSELDEVIEQPHALDEDALRKHIRTRLPLPLPAWRDLDEAAVARFSEQVGDRPGIDILVDLIRRYPQGPVAAHLLGYVGRADIQPEPSEERYHFYLPEWEGKAGVEKAFDDRLRGEAGARLMRVDVSGFRHEELGAQPPKHGRDVYLSVDLDAQRAAEAALEGVNGAAVVIDPRNGDVLAMAASPTFDPNLFVPTLASSTWRLLVDDPDKPLLNRAIQGVYAPGSTFKPAVALAALSHGRSTPGRVYDCPGSFELGRARFHCWYRPGHGAINMREALKYSCNVYFFHLGLLCGVDPIVHTAAALGLGEPTGIDLPGEASGLLPDGAWKRAVFNDDWRDGDTCNLSIGQGFLGVTPLQLAMLCSAIANGGALYRPRLALDVGDPDDPRTQVMLVRQVHGRPEDWAVLREGMREVVNAPDGTGRTARSPYGVVAGKTGTAEYGVKGSGLKLAWMMAFAPYEHPRFAAAMVIEEGVSGGSTAGPRMRMLMDTLLRLPAGEERGGA